jgi:hypothetical protein
MNNGFRRFSGTASVPDLLHSCGRHYKLIVVGDAWMAPYELWQVGGGIDLGEANRRAGIDWLLLFAQHFDRSTWLNPEPAQHWRADTIAAIAQIFEMFPLTLEGLGDAVAHLQRGPSRRPTSA